LPNGDCGANETAATTLFAIAFLFSLTKSF